MDKKRLGRRVATHVAMHAVAAGPVDDVVSSELEGIDRAIDDQVESMGGSSLGELALDEATQPSTGVPDGTAEGAAQLTDADRQSVREQQLARFRESCQERGTAITAEPEQEDQIPMPKYRRR